MKKIIVEGLDIEVYEDVLSNGLRVYLCNIPRYMIHARISSLFGGSTLEFKVDDEFVKVPAGVAHFLEHKLFDKKDYDPLTVFENNGASGNAFTNEFITSYHFTGAEHFFDNLSELLTFVHDPYFTEENVEKEKGIIMQEKKEDMDSNYSKVYDRALLNTFHNLDYKNTVLGSLEDIKSITKDDLCKCYSTFYHPSNMILTICGDIDIEKTFEFIRKFYSKRDFGERKKIVLKEKKEPNTVVRERQIMYGDNFSNEILVMYKIKKPNIVEDDYLNKIYFSMFVDMNFSGLSEIVDITSNDKNFLSPISPRIGEVDDFYTLCFKTTVKKDCEKVVDFIDNTVKNTDFDEKRFSLIKKAILNSMVLSSESPYEICSAIVNQVRLYGNVISDVHKKIKELDFELFKRYVKDVDLTNRCAVVLKPKQ
ncbi:MAG: insulinase family protein [Bacilli bacterium]|nr:insulinase family protein [Bacilli bacterium]